MSATESLPTVGADIPRPTPPTGEIGAAALSSAIEAPEQPFVPKTNEKLLEEITTKGKEMGLDVQTLTYAQQASFTDLVHSSLHEYYAAKHKAEWQAEKEDGIAPPLPPLSVKRRMEAYYGEVEKGSTDRINVNTLAALRKQHLPIAIKYAVPLPEIETALDLQAFLDEQGHEIAADSLSDLLVIYGVTLHFFELAKQQREAELEVKPAADTIESDGV